MQEQLLFGFDESVNKGQKKCQYLEKNKNLIDTKLWAILDVLKISIIEIKTGNLLKITIFTDSQAALAKIMDSKAKNGREIIRALIEENAHKIKSNGYTLVLK